MAESAAGDALFERTGKVSFVQVLPHALQHVLAAFAGIVTPAIIIASVCGFTPQEEAAVIQASLVLSALDIFLQQFPIKGVVGSGLPIVMGASFTFVPALKAVGLELGFEAVLGAQVIGGALVALFGLLFRRVSFLFPAPVLGTVIFVIGLSLCPVAVASMAGGEGAADFGSVTNWAIALVTFVVTFMAGNYGKGALRLGSILAGICAGFVLAAVLGMVDFSAIATASWFAPPALGAHRLVFDPSACAVVGVVAIVNAVQVMGEFAAVSSAALDTPATDSQISGGLIANGLVGMLSGFFGRRPHGNLWPECGHYRREQGRQPYGLYACRRHLTHRRPAAQVRGSAHVHSAAGNRRRHDRRVRNHRHERRGHVCPPRPVSARYHAHGPLYRLRHGH